VRLSVIDMLGQEVAVLVDGMREAGIYSEVFDASELASGMYLCRLKAGSVVQSRKILLTR
jgi:glucuronoarabinoxylan endo-1,4-beta-xylanase